MNCTIAIPKFEKDQLRKYMQSKYTAALHRAGAKAVWINTDDLDKAIAEMLQCDGLLLSGGEDMDPKYYGQTPTEKCGEIVPRRDEVELKMLEAFFATGKPILGICLAIGCYKAAISAKIIGMVMQDSRWDIMKVHRSQRNTISLDM